MIRLPNINSKNWSTSYKGDYLGQIIRNLGIDLFSDYGKVRIGGKIFPHTVGELSGDPVKAIASFTTANINDGAAHPTKIWGVTDDKMIIRGNGVAQFEKDASTGFTAAENTGSGSDILSVADDSEEPLTVTELIIPAGDGAVSIMGTGDNTKWAQSFTQIQGPFKKLSLYIRKSGLPTDNVIVELQTDNAGVPSGTVLTSLTLNAEQFGTSFVLYEYDADEFTDPTINFELDDVYHLVLRRSGSADEANYVMFQIAFAERAEDMEDDDEANPYKNGELQQYNGTTWARTVFNTQTDTFTDDGAWTVPAGVTEAIVECWASGAGGSANVGGGGGGAYSRSVVSLTPTDAYDVTVGQAVGSNENGQQSVFGEDGDLLRVLVVGGGGSGGRSDSGASRSGGGGGGGKVIEKTGQFAAIGSYPVVVGAGGPGASATPSNGNSSSALGIVAIGGGAGGSRVGGHTGADGASGGGGSRSGPAGGASTAGQFGGGTGGGGGGNVTAYGGGGGGAGSAGGNGSDSNGGNGGNGLNSDISGSTVMYGSGGGGGGASAGGTAGSGAGAGATSGIAPSATANLGGGGGGAYHASGGVDNGGAGGSGVVMIRYKTGVITATGGTITTIGGDTLHTFNSSGTFQVTAVNVPIVLAMGGLAGSNGGTGGQATDGIGDIKFDGGGGSLGTGDQGGGGGAGSIAEGGTTGSEIGASGGESEGGMGGGDFNGEYVNGGSMYGGAGNSNASSAFGGGRGEVRITYKIAVPTGYPSIPNRVFGRSTASGSHYFEVPDQTLPGDLLILIMSTAGNNTGATLSGWTKLEEMKTAFNSCTQHVWYKRATGDDSGRMFTTASVGSTYVLYRIINGDVPTATQSAGSEPVDCPEHDTFELAKYLWIAGGTSATGGGSLPEGATAPPTNYKSFITEPPAYLYDDSGLLGAITFVAERFLEAASEDPGAFTGSVSSGGVGVTIAVPYKLQEQWLDLSMSLQVEFAEASERLYVTTDRDIKFLGEEDTEWNSLWMGIFQQEPLDEDFPHPMKLLSAGGVMLVGDKNKLHSMIATGIAPSDVRPSRLIFDSNYFISWIEYTKSAVFIGLQHVSGEDLPGLVCYYEPFTEITRIYTIPDGATVGFIVDENCHIIDRTGQISSYTGSAFVAYDYFPPYWVGRKMTLPHRNGIVVENNQWYCLWEGDYPFPAGIWARENNRLYHKHGFVFEPDVLNSLAAIETPAGMRALYETGDDLLAGGIVYDSDNTTEIEGVFSKNKATGVDVSDYARASFATPRFPSADINTWWQRIFAKIDHLGTGDSGDLVLKYRQTSSQVPEGFDADSYAGIWTSDTTFTCNAAGFVAAVDAGYIKVGNEVIVRRGQGAGLNLGIVSITGTTTKTVTVSNGLVAITDGEMNFSVENWKYIANRDLTGQNSEWLQIKAEIQDNVALEEIQVTSKTNETNNE